ncbi:MAG: cob(I)yrinic acid a,c-diamide adenosyltransferase [Bacteroidetes bacterium]|nr:cob(I)yrinic acid a,c-diamide adenosyltransferase [Bacteroidales bacterium]NJO70180.1 cob(I)yrinic acid a,c-diamide adenosyltransferase [Bacteroidota bacterium]
MKIYTKTGDKGQTSLIGGKRVSKSHLRIEAYGTIDELISHIGLLRDLSENPITHDFLVNIQDRLMICAAILAADCEDCQTKIPEILDSDIKELELEMDAMEETLEPLMSFVLPGGHPTVSHCHIARTVCRRAERIIVELSENFFVPDKLVKYINRLSDYLFVLSRKFSKDFNIDEIPWKARL